MKRKKELLAENLNLMNQILELRDQLELADSVIQSVIGIQVAYQHGRLELKDDGGRKFLPVSDLDGYIVATRIFKKEDAA